MNHGAAVFDDSLAFVATWFDEMAAVDKRFRLHYYPMDNSVELIDSKSGKVHLRRIKNNNISQDLLYVGSQVELYGRKYKIVEFAD